MIFSKQVVVNEQLINYYQNENKNTRTPVVFLHGWQASAQTWNSVLNVLDKNGVPVFALDLPGFGHSELPKHAFSVSDYAEILKSFFDKMLIPEALIVGHSFGGRVAIKFSVYYPAMVKKLVLVDSAGFHDKSFLRNVKVILAMLFGPLFNLFASENWKRQVYKFFGASDYADAGPLRETFVKVINEDLTQYMLQVQPKTLLIWGADDLETPLEYGHRMRQLIQKSRLEVLSGAGHYSFLDKPAEFMKALEEFI